MIPRSSGVFKPRRSMIDCESKRMFDGDQQQRYGAGNRHCGRRNWRNEDEDGGSISGSSFLNMPSIQRVIRFIIEKHPSDEMDVSVPYPTGFHPKTSDELAGWQSFVRDHKRAALFTFICTDRNWGETTSPLPYGPVPPRIELLPRSGLRGERLREEFFGDAAAGTGIGVLLAAEGGQLHEHGGVRVPRIEVVNAGSRRKWQLKK
ncbi:hypothetical protein SASPL_101440 [Salvia splendens]|uniref:Uncharacterized protein n=1 Tax=Salvia splendens TaxID=180675 RepID=A0A8X8YRV7_SALSN|nr:hypothetical protein SASPL_101440 [Salvia splendens]